MSYYKTKGKVWVTKDKRHIPVEELEYDHLLSIIRFLEERKQKLAHLVEDDLDRREFATWLLMFGSAIAWHEVMVGEKAGRDMRDLFS